MISISNLGTGLDGLKNIYSALSDKPKQDKIPFVKWSHELKLVAKALILKTLE